MRCCRVTRRFAAAGHDIAAVNDVSCSVRRGDRIAVTGRSGSGKSTLLHLIAGLDATTGGQMQWPTLGEPPDRRPGWAGMVFQGPSLHPHLNVTENVTLAALLGGADETTARERARTALASLAVDDLAHQLPDTLSTGQSQRVAIARVLAARPSLILADEPTGRLDRVTATRVLSVLRAAADTLDAALIVATHDDLVATSLTTHWRMADGHLAGGDETTDIPAEQQARR